MLRAESHFTAFMLLPAPTPMMAAVLQWLVETGMPVKLETSSVVTVVIDAATPWYFSSFTMSMATALMMRLPPMNVPAEMATEHRIISHRGNPSAAPVSMPKLSIIPIRAMDMNF